MCEIYLPFAELSQIYSKYIKCLHSDINTTCRCATYTQCIWNTTTVACNYQSAPCFVAWSASVIQMKRQRDIVCHPSTSELDQDRDNSLLAMRKYLTWCYASSHVRMSVQSASSRSTRSTHANWLQVCNK